MNNLWTFGTYETVLEVAGFDEVRFLEHHEYIGSNDFVNSTREERAIWEEAITWKGTVLKVFRAIKA